MAQDSTATTSQLEREMAGDRRRGYVKFIKFTGVSIALIVILLALMALFLA